ncbi:MAG: M50 family metallopeptidase [Planctomycetes bacterium]|nr:M50 family metallopeptidase [Planctomycetota bacterium]
MFKKIGKIALLDTAILALLVIGTRLATVLHEILGHGLMTIIYGGKFNGFYITYFGGGFAYTEGGESFLSIFGGILLNLFLACMTLCIIVMLRKRISASFYAALLVFFGINSIGGLEYAVTSSYYRYGDAFYAEKIIGHIGIFWIPAMILIAAMSLVFLKLYADFISGYFGREGPFGRILYTVITLGVSLAAYGFLLYAVPEPLAQADARSEYKNEVIEQIKETKKNKLELERIKEILSRISKGEGVPEELRKPVDAGKIKVSEKETAEAMPFPVEAALLAIYAASMTAAAFVKYRIGLQVDFTRKPGNKTTALLVITALLFLAAIFLLNGNFG